MVLCIVTRPIINQAGGNDFQEIVDRSRKQKTLLQLCPLSAEASALYLRRTLQAADLYPLPKILVDFVYDMAAGNPKHIEELAAQLKTHKYIAVQSSGRVVMLRYDLETLPIPAKMEGFNMNLIDSFQVWDWRCGVGVLSSSC